MNSKLATTILVIAGIITLNNLVQSSFSLANATNMSTNISPNYSMVGKDNSNNNINSSNNNNSSNSSGSSNIEPCNMPPCPPGKACIQSCPGVETAQ